MPKKKYLFIAVIVIIVCVLLVTSSIDLKSIYQAYVQEQQRSAPRHHLLCEELRPGMSRDEVLNILRQAGTFTARGTDTLGPDFELNILYTDHKGNDIYGGFDLEFHDYIYYAAVIRGFDTYQDICVFPTDYVDSTP